MYMAGTPGQGREGMGGSAAARGGGGTGRASMVRGTAAPLVGYYQRPGSSVAGCVDSNEVLVLFLSATQVTLRAESHINQSASLKSTCAGSESACNSVYTLCDGWKAIARSGRCHCMRIVYGAVI